jgi:signal transduction histidine kinase
VEKERGLEGVTRFIRLKDLFWIVLFAAIAFFGPDRSAYTIATLLGIGVLQTAEPKFPFFTTLAGASISFLLKIALWYVLLGWTDGISSEYYWVLLAPLISVATSLGLLETAIATLIGCAAYLSFLQFLTPEEHLATEDVPRLILRLTVLSAVAYSTQQLAERMREEAGKHQLAAEQLRQAEAEVRRSERLAALGQMAAGLAHELRNPMGTMKTSAEMLMKNVETSNELAREMASFISSEVDRTNSLITRFLDFARPLALRKATADVGEVLDRAVSQVESQRPPIEVVIYKNYSPDIPPFAFDAELMERVFYNLILNAAQASTPGGTITVKTRRLESMVEAAVIDRGSGIEPKHLENIFNPFFTTKPTGVGLGLAIVSKIVDEHGGKIAVESEPGSGSVFRVYLPLREGAGEKE